MCPCLRLSPENERQAQQLLVPIRPASGLFSSRLELWKRERDRRTVGEEKESKSNRKEELDLFYDRRRFLPSPPSPLSPSPLPSPPSAASPPAAPPPSSRRPRPAPRPSSPTARASASCLSLLGVQGEAKASSDLASVAGAAERGEFASRSFFVFAASVLFLLLLATSASTASGPAAGPPPRRRRRAAACRSRPRCPPACAARRRRRRGPARPRASLQRAEILLTRFLALLLSLDRFRFRFLLFLRASRTPQRRARRHASAPRWPGAAPERTRLARSGPPRRRRRRRRL